MAAVVCWCGAADVVISGAGACGEPAPHGGMRAGSAASGAGCLLPLPCGAACVGAASCIGSKEAVHACFGSCLCPLGAGERSPVSDGASSGALAFAVTEPCVHAVGRRSGGTCGALASGGSLRGGSAAGVSAVGVRASGVGCGRAATCGRCCGAAVAWAGEPCAAAVGECGCCVGGLHAAASSAPLPPPHHCRLRTPLPPPRPSPPARRCRLLAAASVFFNTFLPLRACIVNTLDFISFTSVFKIQ